MRTGMNGMQAKDTHTISNGPPITLQNVSERFPRLSKIWADRGYVGPFGDWVKKHFGIDVEIIKRTDDLKGFKVVPRRWVVERTFGWFGRFKRLSKDYELLPEHSESVIYLAMIWLMLLCHPRQEGVNEGSHLCCYSGVSVMRLPGYCLPGVPCLDATNHDVASVRRSAHVFCYDGAHVAQQEEAGLTACDLLHLARQPGQRAFHPEQAAYIAVSGKTSDDQRSQ